MIMITLPYLPPKEFSRNSREHWSTLHRVQDRTADDVFALLREAGWEQSEPWTKAEVTLTFVLPDRRTRDADNLITAAKPIMDALVTHQVIQDDCISCIGIPAYKYTYSREKLAGTIIEVEEKEHDPGTDE